MASFLDVCRFNATSAGTGDFVVSTNVLGYQTPAIANAVDGSTYRYRAESADLTQWEIGFGVYTAASATLTRTTIRSNSLGTTAKVNFSAPPQVGVVVLSEDLALIPNFPLVAIKVASIAALQAIDTTQTTLVDLTASGRAGIFVWTTGNYSAQISADTTQGVYIKANAIAATAGAWVRFFDGVNYFSQWFGTTIANSSAANSALISTALVVMGQIFASMSSVLRIEPGIKFSATGLTFSGVSNQVHIELDYLADNETSQGSQSSGQGSSEHYRLIVSSGFPNSTGGGMTAESIVSAPLNPGMIIDVRKGMANTDPFFNDGVAVPANKQNRLPPLNNSDAARASLIIRDEGVNRFGAVYSGYANSTLTSTALYTYRNTRALYGSAGFTSAAAWGGVAGNIPVAGDIITGQTSGFRGVVYGAVAGDVVNTNWIQGRPVGGEFFRNERTGTVSSVALTGSPIGYSEVTNPAIFFAINTPNISIDVEPGDLQTVFGVGGRLTITKSRGLSGQVKETVTNPALMFTEGVADATAALQIVYDTSVAKASRRLYLDRSNTQGSGHVGHVGSSSCHGAFSLPAGTLTLLGSEFNVSSIVKNSIGTFTVNFTAPLATTKYKVVFGKSVYSDQPEYSGRTISSFVITVRNTSGTLIDPTGEIAWNVIGGDI